MNKALKFAVLDFRLIRPYLKSLMSLLFIGIVMGIVSKSSVSMSTFFLTGLLMVISYPFTISERSGMEMLYSTLPLTRKTVVRGRYLFVLLLELLSIPLTMLLSVLLTAVTGEKLILSEIAAAICMMSGLFSASAAMQCPIYFKYGYTKGRFPALIPMFVIFLGFITVPYIAAFFGYTLDLGRLFADIEMKTASILSLLGGTAALGLSSILSCRIYAKKDL